MALVEVVDYRGEWPYLFEQLRTDLAKSLGLTALAIEHVGSTSVPGLCAKPIIDIDVVVRDSSGVEEAIAKLTAIGYRHRGNLGVLGREAFHSPISDVRHSLYVCTRGSLGLRNHLAVRDALRKDPALAAEYGALKKRLAQRFRDDIDGYVSGKSGLLLSVLEKAGFDVADLDNIRLINSCDK